MHSDTLSASISVCVLNGSIGYVVAARVSAWPFNARLGNSLPSLSSSVNASAAAGKKSCNNELQRTSHLWEAGEWNGPIQYATCVPCVVGSNERGRGDSRSPSHSSGALIGSYRASYASQATREKRVRETIQYATCVPCVACSKERERGDPRSPSHSSGALIGRYHAMQEVPPREKRVREPTQYRAS